MYLNNFFKIVGDTLAIAKVLCKYEGLRQGLRHAVWHFISFRVREFARFLFDCYSILYARVCNKPLIYAIGDSHVKVFRRKRLFVVYHLGAATAHNLGKKNSLTNSNRKLFSIVDAINRKDIVLLCFGEIDCRIHIYYQYKKNNERKAIGELINDTVSNYGEVLGKLRELGVNFLVCGVPPATRARNEYRYQFYASPEVHAQINRMFNEKLRGLCEKNGYQYIDVHSRFSDEGGYMLKEYAADEIHLSSEVVDFVRGELNEKLGRSI